MPSAIRIFLSGIATKNGYERSNGVMLSNHSQDVLEL